MTADAALALVDRAGPPPMFPEHALSRFLANKLAVAGFVVSALLVALALVALLLPESLGYSKSDDVLLRPGWPHLFGTDDIGRDLFWRVVRGSSYTLGCGTAAVAIALSAGIPLGLVSGYAGGKADLVIMRAMDLLLAFPSLLLALALMSAIGANLQNAVVAIGIVYTPRFARVIRSTTLQAREMEYVAACEVAGGTAGRIVFRHILPNTFSPILVLATISMSGAILEVAALSFLGLGATDKPEWGNMLTEARRFFSVHPHLMIFPGLALAISVFAVNLLGDGLRDALDVRLKTA